MGAIFIETDFIFLNRISEKPIQKPMYKIRKSKKFLPKHFQHLLQGVRGNIYKCNFDYALKKYRFVGSLLNRF